MKERIHTVDLIKRYRGRTVVNKSSIEVSQGEIVGLLGPNGAGKTTSFYMVVGLVKPDEGEVFLNDVNITKLPMYKRAQMGIGYLPQEASVFRKLSVEDNITAVLQMTKLTRAEQKHKLESLLAEFRLGHVRKSPGDVLSGGERRRTEIARALAVNPKFILLDEPFAGIDPIAVEDIQGIVARLKYKDIGILITDHNVTETLSITDRAYLMFEGKLLKAGTAEELATDEQVKKLYLGRDFVLKRKDWLHEEALEEVDKNSKMTPQNLTSSIKRLSSWTEQLLEDIQSGKVGDNREDELGLDDYAKAIDELQQSIKRNDVSDMNAEVKSRILELRFEKRNQLEIQSSRHIKSTAFIYLTQATQKLKTIRGELSSILSLLQGN